MSELTRAQEIRMRLVEAMYEGWVSIDNGQSNHTIQNTLLTLEKYVDTGELRELSSKTRRHVICF